MSKRDRARIARENGAKSKGPITPEGKAKVSANAVKTGEHIEKLTEFLPPHPAVLCNEDRPAYYLLLKQNLVIYRPANQLAAGIVREITIAQWQIERYHTCLTVEWNLAIIDNATKPSTLAAELKELQVMARATDELLGANGAVSKINREIGQLHRQIAAHERRIKFINLSFPSVAPAPEKQTQPENTQPTETTPVKPQPIYITETSPEVIAAYRLRFPNREIIILPPDDVAKGINLEDDLQPAPRNHS